MIQWDSPGYNKQRIVTRSSFAYDTAFAHNSACLIIEPIVYFLVKNDSRTDECNLVAQQTFESHAQWWLTIDLVQHSWITQTFINSSQFRKKKGSTQKNRPTWVFSHRAFFFRFITKKIWFPEIFLYLYQILNLKWFPIGFDSQFIHRFQKRHTKKERQISYGYKIFSKNVLLKNRLTDWQHSYPLRPFVS